MAVQAPSRSEPRGSPSADERWGVWSLGLAREVTTRLADRESFEAAVTQLSALLAELGCDHVSGVSPLGERLAQAVVAQRPAVITHGTADTGRVAFVDSVINTGVNLVGAMRDARTAGVRDVVGVALVAQRVAISAWDAEGETLRGVEEI